jgi:hypothetical protein
MTDLFEQTVQVLVALAMSEDAEKLDDAALSREVDPLIDAYLVWVRTRRPASFRPRDYSETTANATSLPKRSDTISERIRARVVRRNEV